MNRFHEIWPTELVNSGVIYDSKKERNEEYKIEVSTINDTKIGSVGLTFHLQRYSHPFITKYYLPCMGLVILTSISFFIPPKVVPGRGGILVTLFLVLNNIYSHSKVSKLIFWKIYLET